MKKTLIGLMLSSFVIASCGTTGKQVPKNSEKEVKATQQKEFVVSKECKNYVSKMEKCLNSAKGKDYRKLWTRCEGQVMWDMLKEYEDNGFCFDEDECRQKVLEKVNNCKKERNYLFRKYYK